MRSPFTSGRPRIWTERETMRALPKEWGIYRFINEHEKVDYVGITSNIYNRISLHRSRRTHYDPDIHVIHYQTARSGVNWDDLREWEKVKIKKHSPHLVTYIGGNGRRPAVEINGKIIEVQHDESIEDAIIREGLFNRIHNFMKNLLR